MVFLSLLVLTVSVGCSSASKFTRSDFEKKVGVVRPRYDEDNIEKVFTKKVNLPKPFSVAVFFKDPSNKHDDRAWRWSLAEKEKFIEQIRKNTNTNLVSQVFLMEQNFKDNADLKDLRLAAAKYGADSLLVVEGMTDTVRERTPWATTYALILPTLFINGNQATTFFAISASLWDVRNEMLYLTMNSEGEDLDKYPAAWWKGDSEYIEKTKNQALLNMYKDMGEDLSILQAHQ
jgi:hypothetical protein